MAKIKIHEKALGHLSRGLYRSPASAIRELVSNAWDANASVVRISTNYPNFFQVSIEDNGDGFSKEDFKTLMDGGIGYSEKRLALGQLIHGRPMIGRLGIGMLGIAQICGSFVISSKPKEGEPFRARVRLFDLLKIKLDKDKPEVVVSADGGREVLVGEYDFEDITSHRSIPKRGTRILADAVHPTFTRAFRESLEFEKYEDPPLNWSKAQAILQNVHTLQELGDYWRLLWELSVTCPVPYLSARAVPSGAVSAEHKLLQGYEFKVVVDGIELLKPVLLRGNRAGYTVKRIERQQKSVYNRNLDFHGYIAVQEGRQLKPDELRGVLVRIKNISIGYYDPNLLDYRYNEGPRAKWLTGEVFIEEGLEDALNIDRDSFNRFHPEFRALQEEVHKFLHDEIFPEVYKQIEVRTIKKAKKKNRARTGHLKEVISRALDAPVLLRSRKASEAKGDTSNVLVKKRKDTYEVALPATETIKTRKSNRGLAAAILSIFELAIREKSPETQRERFSELLLDLLSHW